VRILDGSGNPVQGVTVTFTPDVLSNVEGANEVVTGGDGIATAPIWRLGILPGLQHTLTAAAEGVAGSVTFTAEATLLP
jgi:hypothetical protein